MALAAAAGASAAMGIRVARAADTMAQAPMSAADAARTSLHQAWEFAAGAERIYGTLLDAKAFAAFSGGAAEIDPAEGGAFTLFDKRLSGRNVELVPAKRIVQAWRSRSWPAGVYSIVEFQFLAFAGGTRVLLDHTGFPQGKFRDLDSGWHAHYEQRLKTYLG